MWFGKAAVPENWQNFLRADSNKTEQFNFLSKILLQGFCKEDKEVMITDGKRVLNTLLLQVPCSHDETDSRRIVHISHAAQHGHHQILIHTVDTDVVVFAVFAINHLPARCTHSELARAHNIAASLGPEMSCALPMFHALTGCDTVSSFAGHGKKAAWST